MFWSGYGGTDRFDKWSDSLWIFSFRTVAVQKKIAVSCMLFNVHLLLDIGLYIDTENFSFSNCMWIIIAGCMFYIDLCDTLPLVGDNYGKTESGGETVSVVLYFTWCVHDLIIYNSLVSLDNFYIITYTTFDSYIDIITYTTFGFYIDVAFTTFVV